MTFRVAISGLNAAQSELAVTANNIANSSTTGFKGSRVQFAELYSASAQGGSTFAAGTPWRIMTSAVAWLGVTYQSECARCQARFTEMESVTTVIRRGRAGSSRGQRRAIM